MRKGAITQTERVLRQLRQQPVLRSRDLERLNVPRQVLKRLIDDGQIQRLSRGTYALVNADPSLHQALLEAQKRVPSGIICLLSALRFHELTTQNPFEVWMAVDGKAHRPRVEYPPLRIVRFSGRSRTMGVQTHNINGMKIRVTSPARTVADCFKYRHKIGLDVAIESLKDFRQTNAGTIDELWEAAALGRVARVIKPYLEAIEA